MNFTAYRNLVKSINKGKVLPDAIYLHTSFLEPIPRDLLQLFHLAFEKHNSYSFNLIKIFRKEFRVSFLNYPDFESQAHPALHYSITVNLENNESKFIDYRGSENPPILHRKETFISENNPLFKMFSDLTKREEEIGILANTNKIGFKKYWDGLLKRSGFEIQDHIILKIPENTERPIQQEIVAVPQIERHKTAISRVKLSRPLQTVLGYDLLSKNTTYLDYGCGFGDDINELAAHGYQVAGWDPVHKPNGIKAKSEVVNLGFVLNVIEDIRERIFVLKEAYLFAQKLLVVSVLTKNGVDEHKGKTYKDGIVTSRNTFQKYYEQEEIKEFLEKVLGQSAIAVSMGIFYIYREETDYLEHINRQYRSQLNWQFLVLNNKPKEIIDKVKIDKYEKHNELILDFWGFILQSARCPKAGEFLREAEIKLVFNSLNKCFEYCLSKYGNENLVRAEELKKESLLIFFGLMQFKKKIVYAHLTKSVQNDIKLFFENAVKLEEASKKQLFQLGDAKLISKLCEENKQLGYLDEQALYVLTEKLIDLPLLLKLYVYCATQYYGTIENIDIIKIHRHSGKVTLLVYDDLINNPLPELRLRIKVALRGQKIDIFNYKNWPEKQLLYYKSKFLPQADPRFADWSKIDSKLRKLNIPETDYGPGKEAFNELLNASDTKVNF